MFCFFLCFLFSQEWLLRPCCRQAWEEGWSSCSTSVLILVGGFNFKRILFCCDKIAFINFHLAHHLVFGVLFDQEGGGLQLHHSSFPVGDTRLHSARQTNGKCTTLP